MPQFQDIIDDAYSRSASQNGITNIPVGKAWELAIDLRPAVELYTDDGSHATPLGTLLSACVITSVITGEIPETIPVYYSVADREGETVDLMYMDPLELEFCLRITREIIRESR